MELTPEPLPFDATNDVVEALAALGRTEDIAFSPGYGRLVVAGFKRNSLLLIDFDVEERRRSGRLALTGCTEVFSPDLHAPHGLSFLNEHTLVVANREGLAGAYVLPPTGDNARFRLFRPARVLRGSWTGRIATPGSLATVGVGPDCWDVLVCNNYRDTVTCHRLEGPELRVRSNRVLLRDGLSVPDGICVSRDGRWLAVSNHYTASVLLYEDYGRLNSRSTPDGLLLEVDCPHGLKFSAGARWLFAASAASPYIFVYAAGSEGWRGEHRPAAMLRVMDDETFMKGRYNPEEGGPKGLTLSDELDLLVTTSEHQRLAFYELSSLVGACSR